MNNFVQYLSLNVIEDKCGPRFFYLLLLNIKLTLWISSAVNFDLDIKSMLYSRS